MKILKWILIVLLVISGIYLIFSATQPNQILVEETIEINAPAEAVYAEIIDFKRWDNWSAWNKMDPNMEKSFSGEPGTIGAKSSWKSENPMVGVGSHEVIELEENKYFKTKMLFGESTDENYASFRLEESDGKTKVIWDMEGAKSPFYLNAMNTFFKPMVEESYRNSLKDLKALIESKPAAVEVPNPMNLEVKEVDAIDIISIKDSTDAAGISNMLRDLYTELAIFMASKEMEMEDMPLAIYYSYSPEKVVLEAAMKYKGEAIAGGEGRVVAKQIPAGKAIFGIHYGDYNSSGDMHNAIEAYGKASNLEFGGMCWEVYANDPTEVDSAAVETHIYYPVSEL